MTDPLRAALRETIETRARLADALDALRAAILWLHGDYRTTDRSQFDAESWYRKARSGVAALAAALAADAARPDPRHDMVEFLGWLFRDGGLEPPRREYEEVEEALAALVWKHGADTARPGLDVAWAEAEAALPEGWTLEVGLWRAEPKRPAGMADYEATASPYIYDSYESGLIGRGDTPAEAVSQLAAALAARLTEEAE